jgi:type I restriction enzyme S subunit
MKKGWQTKTLGEACEMYQPKTISGKDMVEDGAYLVYGANGVIGRYNQFNHEEPQLLITCRGATCGSVNISAPRSWVTGNAMVVRPKSGTLEMRYLEYLFRGGIDISKGITGAAQPQITRTNLEPLEISFPESLAEQQRIVGLLDEAFEGLATAKANAEKNLQNARALFESHLQSVFTQRGPGWVETTLGNVVEFVGGSQPPKSVFSKTQKADNIRLIQIRDYKSDKHIVFIPRAQARRFCNADDVMIGRYGPPLFQILRGIEGAYNVALMKAVPDEAKLSRDFLFYFLKHSAILQYVIYHSSRAAGQIGVTKETLEPYPIALPSLAVQKTVVENIRELDTETQRLARLYERKLAALEALKKSLLHEASSGEL